MGMAASQGRLLALTARMHDIELRAQYLESQKLSLATQQDAAYQKYCDALDATKIQVGRFDALSTNGVSYVDANFNSVMGFHPLNCTQYSMINNLNGKVIVSPEIKDLYEQYNGDKYSFAWAAMGYDSQFGWDDAVTPGAYGFAFPDGAGGASCVGIANSTFSNYIIDPLGNYNVNMMPEGVGIDGATYSAGWGEDLYMTEVEFAVFLNHADDEELMEAYDKLREASGYDQANLNNHDPIEPPAKRRELLDKFKAVLYNKYGEEILAAMNENKNGANGIYFELGVYENPDVDFLENTNWNNVAFQKEFNYYMSLWTQITDAGGCESIDSQYASGVTGTEWFNNMVTSGQVTLFTLDDNEWQVTTIATSVGDNYLQEVNDEVKAKKAEVEYEHELDIINRKDTKFDLQLKKLETEENACKTELDSLKQVKNDNIERTFNLFS